MWPRRRSGDETRVSHSSGVIALMPPPLRRDDVHDVERRARPNRCDGGDGGIAFSIEVGAQRFDESFGRRFVELDDHVDIVGGPRLAVQ
jgi:hypothetical protein